MSDEAFEADSSEPGTAADEAAARLLRSAWKSSPGLVLSLSFHGAILAVLPIIVFQEKIRELAGIPITIGVSAVRVDPERPYKPIAGGPPSSSGEGLLEAPVYFPEALAAERNESKAKDGQEDRSAIDGESRALLTHFASDSQAGGFAGRLAKGPPGTNFVMGVGGGSGTGGARHGTSPRAAGRQNLVARGGGSKHTEAAVELGLSWLARHQSPDGSWSSEKYPCKTCTTSGNSAQVAATSLAVLAFLTAGYGPDSDVTIKDRVTDRPLRYGNTVRAGINYLRSQQQRGEWIQSPGMGEYHNMYEHSFATMTLCEAYRVTRNEDIKDRAERALAKLYETQGPFGAWQDTSVTGACVQAFRAAQNAGLTIPKKTLERLQSYLERVGDPKTGSTGYNARGPAGVGMVAIGLYARRFLNPGRTVGDKFLALAAKSVAAGLGTGQFTPNMYDWYYAMLGLFEYEGPTGKSFESVNKAVTTALVSSQHRDRECRDGSWDGVGGISGYGAPLATAMSVLTLETYYRYVDVAAVESGARATPTPTPR